MSGGFGSLFAGADQIVVEVDARVKFSFNGATATTHPATTILAEITFAELKKAKEENAPVASMVPSRTAWQMRSAMRFASRVNRS